MVVVVRWVVRGCGRRGRGKAGAADGEQAHWDGLAGETERMESPADKAQAKGFSSLRAVWSARTSSANGRAVQSGGRAGWRAGRR